MNKEIWTVGRILQWTEQYFQSKEMDSPRLDGEVLLSHMLGKDRIYLYTHYDQPLIQSELDSYRALVLERAKGRSVASIVGVKEFMGLPFKVNDNVLIPRPDTETLVEYILTTVPADASVRIVDVCSGPGTILLSLLHYLPNATGIGLEISPLALEVAHKNLVALGLSERAQFYESNMFSHIEGTNETFDIIVSNPPYITTRDMKNLSLEVLSEPHIALEGGHDGLDFYRILASENGKYCIKGGTIAMEVGINQHEQVKQLLLESGDFSNIEYAKDLGNIERVVIGHRI